MIRLWMYGIIICFGSVLLSWHQSQYFVTNFGPGNDNNKKHHRPSTSSFRKFPPAHVENERTTTGGGKEQQSSLLESESEASESRSSDTLTDDEIDAGLKGTDDDDNTGIQREEKDLGGGGAVIGKLAEFHEPVDGTIQSISLLGERNSGTRWIYGYVIVMCLWLRRSISLLRQR